jgi:ethanolaminephosphotransferase
VCKRYQDLLSIAASNYDLRMMTGGMIVMLVASVVSAAKLYPLLGDSSLANWSFLAITLSYVGMMFASSYVEEEQNFWYWIACGWLMALFLKQYVSSRAGSPAFADLVRSKRNGHGGKVILLTLALLRVVRRWNQTGLLHGPSLPLSHSKFK